jgi:hypothetical protein
VFPLKTATTGDVGYLDYKLGGPVSSLIPKYTTTEAQSKKVGPCFRRPPTAFAGELA